MKREIINRSVSKRSPNISPNLFFTCALIALFNIFCFDVRSQETLNTIKVEQTSYQLYVNKNWKDLAAFANKAIKQDFDYYYLRMRAGIANYELGKYIVAQKHFEKALQFNSGDELVLEYLYFCYVFTNRYEEARWLSKTFSASLAKKLKTDNFSPVAYIIAEGGVKMADSTRLLGNGNYFHVGLSHYVAKRFSLYHAVTYYGQSFSDGRALTGRSTQFQYYLGGIVPVKNNWQISPGFQVITKNVLLHIPLPLPPPPPFGQHFPRPPMFKDSTSNDNYFVGSINIKKSISQFDFNVSSTFSSVFGNTQFQHGLSFSFLPVKAKQIIMGCNGFIHTENSYSNNYFAVNPFLYLKPFNGFSLTGSYLLNTGGKNVVEGNGYIVNNSADLTTSRWSLMASVAISKQVDVYGLYQFENKEAAMAKYEYHYNLIVFGIKIKPK